MVDLGGNFLDYWAVGHVIFTSMVCLSVNFFWLMCRYWLLSLIYVQHNFICLFQDKAYFYLGQYAAMSILQGGNGLPFFSECVYRYFAYGVYTKIDVSIEEIPDSTLEWVVQKVRCTVSDN